MGREIAMEIVRQLGGPGRLKAMINAKKFIYDSKGKVTFKFSGCRKMNVCHIQLNGADLYDMTFEKYKEGRFNKEEIYIPDSLVEVSKHTDIYNDQLVELFERETGLYLSL